MKYNVFFHDEMLKYDNLPWNITHFPIMTLSQWTILLSWSKEITLGNKHMTGQNELTNQTVKTFLLWGVILLPEDAQCAMPGDTPCTIRWYTPPTTKIGAIRRYTPLTAKIQLLNRWHQPLTIRRHWSLTATWRRSTAPIISNMFVCALPVYFLPFILWDICSLQFLGLRKEFWPELPDAPWTRNFLCSENKRAPKEKLLFRPQILRNSCASKRFGAERANKISILKTNSLMSFFFQWPESHTKNESDMKGGM